ncbi:hypothetical protein F511_01296 [Dorcoceras hygrometricum]|uniref:Uncharacterized protein n=1 Tax=Dorcoceras hygrometricum TaxID=472368 RepID=A0A2Z7DAU5_9LAMI|nr:hypothetical protein F511_01296 [Dorcoceras hygrometricum]
MARQILLNTNQVRISHIGLGIGTLLLSAFALFLCANHSTRRIRKWRACYGYRYQEPVIQLIPDDIPSFHVGEMDPSTCSGEEISVWKKNILMGGKCQLPEFSGVIIYDSAGNVVTPAKTVKAHPPLRWE